MCVCLLLRLVAPYIDFTCNRQPCCPLLYIWILNYWRLDVWLVHVVFILFLLNCSWDRANYFVTARVVLFLLPRHYLFISNAIWLYLNHCFRCHLAASNWLDIFGCQHLPPALTGFKNINSVGESSFIQDHLWKSQRIPPPTCPLES